MSERFEIGETEKHYITIDWSIFSKHLKIERDGEVITDEMHLSPLPTKVESDIGSAEPHHVQILAGGFHRTEVRVDGKKIEPLR